MKTTNIGLTVALVCGAIGFGTEAFAVDVANPGFEALWLPDDPSFNDIIPQWTRPSDGRSGTMNPGPASFPGGVAPEGFNVAYAATGGLFQQLSTTVQPNTAYTLTVQVGRGFEAPTEFRGYVVKMLAGGQVMASDFNNTHLEPGTFSQVQVTYKVDAADSTIGQPLGIYLGSADLPTASYVNAYFDSVSLWAAPVPEPTSA